MKPASYTNIKECASTHVLEQYQQGKLDKGVHKTVASHLSTCQLCEFTATISPRIDKQEMEEDMAKINRRIKDRLFEQKRKKRRQFLSKVAAGLLFLLTAGIGTYLFTTSSSTSGTVMKTNLYSQYYQSYEISEDLMQKAKENSPTISPALAQAIATYKKMPYQKPMLDIPTSSEQIPEDVAQTRLLTALTDLENGRVHTAISLLEKVQQGKTKFSDDAAWYLALAHIKNGTIAKASPYLDALIAKGGTYAEKAKALKGSLAD